MVTFPEAIANGFRNYVNFTGRSTRAEYWWWTLFTFILSTIANIIDDTLLPTHLATRTVYNFATGAKTVMQVQEPSNLLALLLAAALFLPGLALVIRRLRDTAHHWAWIFIILVPIGGIIVLIVFYCQPSSPQGWGQPTSYKNPISGGGPIGSVPNYYG